MIEGGSNSAPGLSNEGFEVQSMSRYVSTSCYLSVIARKFIATRMMCQPQYTLVRLTPFSLPVVAHTSSLLLVVDASAPPGSAIHASASTFAGLSSTTGASKRSSQDEFAGSQEVCPPCPPYPTPPPPLHLLLPPTATFTSFTSSFPLLLDGHSFRRL